MTALNKEIDASPCLDVNGAEVSLDGVAPYVSLLEQLRGIGLTGAKEGCAEGECGACAVLVNRPATDGGDGSDWVAVNSCMPPALAFAGLQIRTAEGLGSPRHLHPVQEALAAAGASQCGYCTPGFACSMAAEFYRADPSEPFDEHAIGGNLCRCTGYRPILDAAHGLGAPTAGDPMAARRDSAAAEPAAVVTEGFVRPASFDEALELLATHAEAQPVAGATDVGVLVNLAMLRPGLLVAVDRLAPLREFTIDDTTVHLGAGLSLTEIETRLAGRIPLLDNLFPQFASRLIRNAATLGGNLATASPIGDSAPALLALEARVHLASRDGIREVALSDFFTGYRTTVLEPGELIVAVSFERVDADLTAFHKIAKRRLDDISSVAVAYHLQLADGVVSRARIGLGGVAATPIRARATEAALTGRPWTEQTADEVAAVLAAEGTPMSDHRASESYRRAMLATSLPRLFAEKPLTGARTEATR